MKQSAVAHSELSNLRETVESIWIAIIMAFVVRAFLVEAFVIPTGSMAPRLMGQHYLARCPECGEDFDVGTRSDATSGPMRGEAYVTCPNCRKEFNIESLAQAGDRVLVLKYLYDFRQPRRWDVVVFKDPQGTVEASGNITVPNFIKRLVGLPGEAVRIIHGDVFVHPISDGDKNGVADENDLNLPRKNGKPDLTQLRGWEIARKGDKVQEAMWQIVFDNDYRPAEDALGQPWQKDEESSGWDLQLEQGRVFQFASRQQEWLHFADGQARVFVPSNAYNGHDQVLPLDQNTDLCSDLKLETTVLPQSSSGMISLTLSNFEHEFAAEFGFDGHVRLLHRIGQERDWSDADVWGEANLPAWQQGTAVKIALAHADWRVTVWVDGQGILASDDKQYSPDVEKLENLMRSGKPVEIPRVSIAAANAQCQLWHTRVWRDVFYTCSNLDVPREGSILGHYAFSTGLVQPMHSIPGWGTMNNPIALRAYKDRPDLDEFYMLGDNSPASKDSRLWYEAAPSLKLVQKVDGRQEPLYRLGTVPRYNLIGKAFFVYWPAGGKLWPPDKLPIVPNVGNMRRIR